MKINYNLTGAKRKALVGAISQELNEPSKYLGAPSFAYEIGHYQVDKDGLLQGPDNPGLVADLCGLHSFEAIATEFDTPPAKAEPVSEDVQIPYEAELGGRISPYRDYEEPPVYASPDSLVIELPSTDFTEVAFDNLEKIISAKSSLIKKAVGAKDLTIERTESTLRFPWFALEPGNEAVCVNAYTHFVFGLCKLAKTQQRVNEKEKTVENEKYAFRCFLLRLGFVGEEFKDSRKLLLAKLTGNSAFKNKVAEDDENE